MHYLHIEQKELWDDENSQFIYIGPKQPITVPIEHSLHSIYKWESKYKKSYMNTENKTINETLDYIQMMIVGPYEDTLSANDMLCLDDKQMQEIKEYIDDPMTATTFSKEELAKAGKTVNKITTAEIIYYYMTALNIPFECEMWHINRLMTLIRVCAIENDPKSKKKKNKMSSSDMALRRARMEAARAKYNQ